MRKLILLLCVLHPIYSFSQVNLPTGSATFSLPIFNWQDDKSRLNSVVELNYNSGNGLKVNDVASNVGQGWNLLQGGVITRMQAGEPDDQKAYPSSGEQVEDITKYPAGYLYATGKPEDGAPSALTRYPIFKDKNHIYKQNNLIAEDRELDYFSFQFNGRNGLFVIDKTSYNSTYHSYTGALIGDSKVKIWCTTINNLQSQQIRTTIDAFYIKDENGLTYKFLVYGLSKVMKTNYCDANLTERFTQPTFKNGNVYHQKSIDKNDLIYPWVVDSWYLSEIIDSLTPVPRKITFAYNTEDLINSAGEDLSYYMAKGYSIISHKTSNTKIPVISSILFPDGHQVSFIYGNLRLDLSGDKVLSAIDITYQSDINHPPRHLSKYIINTSYFILNRYGTPTSPSEISVARLCLLSVQKTGVDLKAQEPPYLFDYNLGSAGDDVVPPPFFYMKDIWGYYNGYNSASNGGTPFTKISDPLSSLSNDQIGGLCFLRSNSPIAIINPRPAYAKNGLLKQIIYPTGGSVVYQYVQNTGSIAGGTITNVGGVHVSSTSVSDGGYSNGCATPIISQYNYINPDGSSSLWGMDETPLNSMTYSNSYTPERRRWKYSFPIGHCFFEYQYPGILSHEDKISLNTGQQILNITSKILNIVGIASQIKDIVTFLGPTPAGPVALIIDAIIDVVEFLFSCLTAPSTTTSTGIVYFNSDTHAVNPLPVQFKRVEIVPGTGTIGKTVEEFTDNVDNPVWQLTNPTLSMEQRYAYWAYGLPKKTTVYDPSGTIKVEETENVYYPLEVRAYNSHLSQYGNFPSCKALVLQSSSQNNVDWQSNTSSVLVTDLSRPDMKVQIYIVYTGKYQIATTYKRTYKPGSTQSVESRTDYQYNINNYQVSSMVNTLSNGDQVTTNFTYNDDYTTGLLATMAQKNIIGVPVSTNTSVSNYSAGKQQAYLSEKVTEYATIATGDIKPSRILEQRFSSPQSVGSISLYNGTGATPPYKQIQTFTYDALGNLSGLQDEGNHIVTNIYDYNDKYVIASVINADPVSDKSSFTSFETPNMGGWQYTGQLLYNYNLAATGSNSLVLSASNTISKNISSSKPYILSFWSTAPLSVANATLNKTVNNINEFVYYEYKVPANTTSVIITGNANVDELRLYPQNARMRTVTYDPLIGKTSECDENNRITYYEYDELARLRFIKNENKQVIKMYEYNYASKQSGCPSLFYSPAVSEIFTKSCSAGSLGDNVTFTIPANKYSSTISQIDADQKLEADILANGQTFANTTSGAVCHLIYYNAPMSQNFTTQSCQVGSLGGSVPYSVPANKYYSIISQAVANQLAQDEIDANGQGYANLAAHASCTVTNAADWEAEGTAQTQCQKDASGNFTGHIQVLMTDVNPSSSTYNTQQMQDAGPNETSCPPTHGSAPSLNGTGFKNASGSGVITGAPGALVTVTVTLNSSDASANLTGNVGVSVHLTGSGNHSVTNVVTIPAVGYISWSLSLSGNLGSSGGYISSNISF